MRVFWCLGLSMLLVACNQAGSADRQTRAPARLNIVRPAQYSSMADASAGVAVNTNLFLVADDEENKLRLYRRDQGGPPIKEFDLNLFLEVYGKSLETDVEGAARIGDRAFWIGSHGRNVDGRERPNRARFFATDIRLQGNEVIVVPVGKPYKRLLEDLTADPRLAAFHFYQADSRAPKEPGGLNIEGLAATPDGRLLIGFRNPVPKKKALLIPINNPNEVVMGKRPAFGAAIQLDLGGLGIRDIALHQSTYVIIAGAYHGGGPFKFYFWDGAGTQPAQVEVKHVKDYHPEGIVLYPDLGLEQIQILSDDGKVEVEGVREKEITDSRKKSFRSFWLTK